MARRQGNAGLRTGTAARRAAKPRIRALPDGMQARERRPLASSPGGGPASRPDGPRDKQTLRARMATAVVRSAGHPVSQKSREGLYPLTRAGLVQRRHVLGPVLHSDHGPRVPPRTQHQIHQETRHPAVSIGPRMDVPERPVPKQPVVKPTRRSSGDPSRLNRAALRRSALRFGRNTPGIPPSRALSAGRLPALGAHPGSTTGC